MKLQPQATELEEAVLGAMLLDRDAVEAVVAILTPESFYLDSHRYIFEAMMALFGQRKPIDLLTVTEQLKKDSTLEIAGGAYYITELTNRIASSAHIEEHARIIAEKQILRSLIGLSSKIQQSAYDNSIDAFDTLDDANKGIEQINDILAGQQSTPEISKVFQQRIKDLNEQSKRTDRLTGITTGFIRLDTFTGGWQKSDLIIIAGRPSMGKTAFMLALANNAVKAEHKVGIVSLEMSKEQLTDRLIATNASIDTHKLKVPANLNAVEWGRITSLDLKNIYIKDSASITIREFRVWAKDMVKNKGCEMLIVDYLQLMEGSRKSGDNRATEVGTISRGLKATAKELKIPVICLSQLNRAAEGRSDGRPRLSDLRESGDIEQDADFVGLLYRPEYYKILQDDMGNSTQGVAELIVEKNRNGDTGITSFKWEGIYTRFLDPEAGFTKISSNGKDEGTPF